MAAEGMGIDDSLLTNVDMSDNQYKLVSATTAGRLALIAVRGGRPIGVIQDNTTAAGIAARYRLFGVSKVVAGDSSAMVPAINFGTLLTVSSQAAAVPSSSAGNALIGFGLEFLSAGSTGVIRAMINISGVLST